MSLGLALHDLADPDGGGRWRRAIDRVDGLDGAWEAPDLPGHGGTPALRTGHYDPMAVVTLARWRVAHHVLAGGSHDASLVVGVGQNAHSSLVLAAGGGCGALVIVDGLHGRWRTDVEEIELMYARLREILADEPATAPAPVSGLDPRTSHGYGVTVTRFFAKWFWGAVTVPMLVIETPSSPTPPDERAERISWFAGPTTLVELDDATPEAVLTAVAAWQHA